MGRWIALILNALVEGPVNCAHACPHLRSEAVMLQLKDGEKQLGGRCHLFEKDLVVGVSKKKPIFIRCRECKDAQA